MLLRVKQIVESALCVLFMLGFNALFLLTLKNLKILIVGLPFLAVAVGFLVYNVKRHREYYAVTNMRVLKIRHGRFYSEKLENLVSAYCLPRMDGRANVYLAFTDLESFRAKITLGRDEGFNFLKKDEAEYVCELLSEKMGKK